MADETLVGKTILQLDLLTGTIDRTKSYIEVHVEGRGASQKVALDSAVLRGLSAKEVVQITHPEIVTDAQFITFITGPQGIKGTDGKDGVIGKDGTNGQAGEKGADGKDGEVGAEGKSAFQSAQELGYQGTEQEWLATLIGKTGADGEAGAAGKNAYELALEDGFVGTLAEWLLSLKGKDGDKGEDGVAGKDGTNGLSAYEQAQANGFEGTEPEWLESLKGEVGPDGKSAYQLAKDAGFEGTEPEWLASLKGENGVLGGDGKSAYEVAVDGGFNGTEPEWLESLKGESGADGKDGEDGARGLTGDTGRSAYQEAVARGYEGTEVEWLASLKGATGDKGTNASVGTFSGTVENESDLPPVEDYEQTDYFIVGTHIFMKNNDEWVDLGNFQGPAGKDGSGITVLGELSNIGFLPVAAERNGDAWLIGKSMYVWNGARWQLQGQEGLQGKQGDKGETGKSALEIIREDNPTVTTNAEMAAFLRGPQGPRGDVGATAVSFVTEGKVNTPANLPAEGVQGHGYIVGTVEGEYEYHVWLNGAWFNMGKNIGPAGPKGNQGDQGNKGDLGRGLQAFGYVPTADQLPANPSEGDTYTVGWPSNSARFGEIYMAIWSGLPDQRSWRNMGNIRGRDGKEGARGPVGQAVQPKGERPDLASLPADGNVLGDAYVVADYLYVYDGASFERMGQWRGQAGTNGTLGKSAYEIAQSKGFVGTEAQWLASLKGKDGVSFQYIGQFATLGDIPAGAHTNESASVGTNPTKLYLSYNGVWTDVGPVGQQGPQGLIGLTGPSGKSAYDVAVENGYGGTSVQWIASLKGQAGKSAYEVAVDGGYIGTAAEWVISLEGTDGLDGQSAYDIAKDEGFVGTRQEWIASLTGKSLKFIDDFASPADFPAGVVSNVATAGGHVYIHNGTEWVDVGPIASGPKGDEGDQGVPGKSAYELAKDAGFAGTEAEYRASLKGDTGAVGKSIYQDAVDRGLFTGTFEEFYALQKGDPGASAYEEALSNGTIPEEATFEEFLAEITGPEGPQGKIGETGPAIRIIGTVANVAALPATGVEGTGYAIADQSAPGTYNCYIWLQATTQWFNLGHIVGATGEKGEQGVRGLQGLRGVTGDKGDVGSIWIVLAREPQAIDGRIDDYFLNSASQEYFRKTGAAVWASLGFMGGGNVYKPNSDGKTKAMKDGAWVDLTLIDSVPTDTETYQLVKGAWKKFDTYTLKAMVATNTVDFDAARVFRIDNTAAATIALTNVPDANHATTVVVKVYGKVGAFQWTLPAGKGTLRWFDGAAPVFTNEITTIVFTWDGREMTGSVPN